MMRLRGAARSVIVLVVSAAVVSVACGSVEATTSGTVGAEGGTVRAGDVTLDIPAGALSSNQTIGNLLLLGTGPIDFGRAW